MSDRRWVLLAYRLPREPSTPRIALWRALRRLGAAQLVDGLVALPADSRTREQLEWLAETVVQAGGEASVWLAEPGTRGQGDEIAARMQTEAGADYSRLVDEAQAAAVLTGGARKRTVQRLRRELRRVARRDYFGVVEGRAAHKAIEGLTRVAEEVAA